MKQILIGAAVIAIATPSASAKCGICSNGNSIVNPKYEGFIPSFGIDTTAMTCEEYDESLTSLTEEECVDTKSAWKIDISYLCGCGGAQLETSVDGGCSMCDAGKVENASDVLITGGYPLSGQVDKDGNFIPITCQFVIDVVPYLKLNSTCGDFQSWYGEGVCCRAMRFSEPTSSSVYHSGVASLALAVASVFALW